MEEGEEEGWIQAPLYARASIKPPRLQVPLLGGQGEGQEEEGELFNCKRDLILRREGLGAGRNSFLIT